MRVWPSLLVWFCVCSRDPVLAQLTTFRVDVGISNNFLRPLVGNNIYTENVSMTGFSASIILSRYVHKRILLQTGLSIIQKNHKQQRTGRFSSIYDTQINLYSSIPVEIGYRVGVGEVAFTLSTGVFFGYWIQSRSKGVIPNIFDIVDSLNSEQGIQQFFSLTSYHIKNKFNPSSDRRFEIGHVSELIVDYGSFKFVKPFVAIRFFNTLTNQQKINNMFGGSSKNKTFVFCVGLKINKKDK